MFGKVVAWLLIVVLGCLIVGNLISIIKSIIRRKKGLSGQDKNHVGEEKHKDE